MNKKTVSSIRSRTKREAKRKALSQQMVTKLSSNSTQTQNLYYSLGHIVYSIYAVYSNHNVQI